MNEDLIKTSLDQSLLALAEIDEGNADLAVAHATISSALATVAAAEASLLVTLPRHEQRRTTPTSTTWIQDIHILAMDEDDGDLTPPEPEVVPPVVVYAGQPQMPGRGPRRGRARAASPPT